MNQYIEIISYKDFGSWEECKEIIEKADPDVEKDFNTILKSIPTTYILPFLQWTIRMGKENLIIERVDDIIQYIASTNEIRNYWIIDIIEFLTKISDIKIEETLCNNLIQIIEGNFENSMEKVVTLCNKCKNIENIKQMIEENYEKILSIVFQKNEFASKDDRVILAIKYLISEICEKENIGLCDIEYIGEGMYSKCLKIGNSVFKIGTGRILEEIPTHRRILKPLLRKNVPSDCNEKISLGILKQKDVIALEYQVLVDKKWYKELCDDEIEDKLYEIYKELRQDNIVWTDIKPENVGRLIKPQGTLPQGELVIFDTDRIYEKHNLPQFNEEGLRKSLYIKFEQKFSIEESCR